MPIGKVWQYLHIGSLPATRTPVSTRALGFTQNKTTPISSLGSRRLNTAGVNYYQQNVSLNASAWDAMYALFSTNFASFNADEILIGYPFGIDTARDGIYVSFDAVIECREDTSVREFSYEQDFIKFINSLSTHHLGGRKPHVLVGSMASIDDNIFRYGIAEVDQTESGDLWRESTPGEALRRVIRSLRAPLYANAPVILSGPGDRGSYDEAHLALLSMIRHFGSSVGYEHRPTLSSKSPVGSLNVPCVNFAQTHRHSNELATGAGDALVVPRVNLAGSYVVIPSEFYRDEPPYRKILTEVDITLVHSADNADLPIEGTILNNGAFISTNDDLDFTDTNSQETRPLDILRVYTNFYNRLYIEYVVKEVPGTHTLMLSGSPADFEIGAGPYQVEIYRPVAPTASINGSSVYLLNGSVGTYKPYTDNEDLNARRNVRPGDIVRYNFSYNGTSPVLNSSDEHLYLNTTTVTSVTSASLLTASGMPAGTYKIEVVRNVANDWLDWLNLGIDVAVGDTFSGLPTRPVPYNDTANTDEQRQQAAWWRARANTHPNSNLNFS